MMLTGSPLGRWLAAALFVSSITGGARGQAIAPNEAEGAPAAEPRSVVVLAVRGDALDVERLRTSLSQELGRVVVLEGEPRQAALHGVVTVAYRKAEGELAVAWDSGGQTVTRVVAAPADAASIPGDAALLAGNLAHAQLDDLLPAAPPALPAAPAATPPAPLPPAPVPPPPVVPDERPVTVGVFYPLASHHDDAQVLSHFDLNLIYGRVGSIDGAQLGGVNVVSRPGEQAVRMEGLQVGFVSNLVHGEVRGVQGAGLFNFGSGTVHGAQLAFGANLAESAVRGLQSSFLFNRSGDLHGLQLSAVNVAGDVDGVQLGIVNVARRVRGVSIGLVNIADDIDGLPLAPFSVTKSGGVHPVLWSGSSSLGNAGVKLATRHTYTLFYGSYHRAFDLQFVGGGFALGGGVGLGSGFRADVDVSGTYLVSPELSSNALGDRTYHEQLVQPRLRLMLAYRAFAHLGAFVGVAATGQVRSELGWERVTASVGPEIFGGIEL